MAATLPVWLYPAHLWAESRRTCMGTSTWQGRRAPREAGVPSTWRIRSPACSGTRTCSITPWTKVASTPWR